MHQSPPLGAGGELQRPHLHDCENGQQQLTPRLIRNLIPAEVFECWALPAGAFVYRDLPASRWQNARNVPCLGSCSRVRSDHSSNSTRQGRHHDLGGVWVQGTRNAPEVHLQPEPAASKPVRPERVHGVEAFGIGIPLEAHVPLRINGFDHHALQPQGWRLKDDDLFQPRTRPGGAVRFARLARRRRPPVQPHRARAITAVERARRGDGENRRARGSARDHAARSTPPQVQRRPSRCRCECNQPSGCCIQRHAPSLSRRHRPQRSRGSVVASTRAASNRRDAPATDVCGGSRYAAKARRCGRVRFCDRRCRSKRGGTDP